MAAKYAENKVESAERFAHQAEKLSLLPGNQRENENFEGTTAVQARFITPQDPVIETADGGRLPAIPLAEAHKLNALKDEAEGKDSTEDRVATIRLGQKDPVVDTENGKLRTKAKEKIRKEEGGTSLQTQIPPSHTNPLFPQLPLYGPPTLLRNIHCGIFRCSSFFLSLAFLGVIVLGSAFTSIPLMFRHIGLRLMFRDPDARRPFYKQEKERQRARKEENKAWKQKRRRRESIVKAGGNTQEEDAGYVEEYIPTEGGKDPLICDVGYYARRVGLDVEEFKVQTEDGFIIALWHVYNPKEYTPISDEKRRQRSPDLFPDDQSTNGSRYGASGSQFEHGRRKYPVLMVHGLLQSAGAYCTNDDDSLAFFLCKSGYDVWLGNNRCGFKPEHQMLTYSDPRMWAWNIRQMGVIDLPALVSRVLSETGFEKLGLICHSQGTTETFVALAKEQRPDLGAKISVFCALAPAVYAGPLIGKMYFKFMRAISPGMFRIFFGIHAFIPFMMTMHALLPGKLYGALGYRVFSFLFNWSDERWDQGLRDRMFQFAPVYVSAESMRWWLGRECFARHKCILATREEGKQEDAEDEDENFAENNGPSTTDIMSEKDTKEKRGRSAWYDDQAPPMALWIAGSDELVDGRRLLRRFEKGREPHVKIVHSKIIEEYEHLDVIWAMDVIEKVGKEVRDVVFKTMSMEDRKVCRLPKGCEEVAVLDVQSV